MQLLRNYSVALIVLALIGGVPLRVQIANAAGPYTMASPNNYSIQFLGSSTTGKLGYASITTGDLDGDGKQDLIMGERLADNNNRTNSGSLYIILGSKLATIAGIGNNINLSNPANWNLRIDFGAGDEGGRSPQVADIDNDGKKDLLVGAYRTGYNGNNSGSIYIIRNVLLQPYLTGAVGKTLDITSSSNYNWRFDGSAGSNQLGWVRTGDLLGNDGKQDLVMGSVFNADKTYVINNTLFSTTDGTGNNYNLATSSNYSIVYRGAYTLDNDAIGDLNHDGLNDLLFTDSGTDYKGRGIVTGAAYGVFNNMINANIGTGNSVDLTNAANYNFIIGGVGPSLLGDWGATQIGDVNADGKSDIVISAASIDGVTFPGYTYILYNDIFNRAGTGNDIDLASNTNWNVRYTGAAEGDWHVRGAMIRIAQLDNQNTNDLVFSAVGNAVGEVAHPGKGYVLFDDKLTGITRTGNVVNLSDTSKYDFRYDGAGSADWLTANGLELSDLNGDGQNDVLMSAWGANGETGSVYLVYYFPHTIRSISSYGVRQGTPISVTGLVQASNNVVNIEDVEYRTEVDGVTSAWASCSATDGAFDSKTEIYACSVPTPTTGKYTISIRAEDEKGIYTTPAHYSKRLVKVSP